jgi:hypothetical protein
MSKLDIQGIQWRYNNGIVQFKQTATQWEYIVGWTEWILHIGGRIIIIQVI